MTSSLGGNVRQEGNAARVSSIRMKFLDMATSPEGGSVVYRSDGLRKFNRVAGVLLPLASAAFVVVLVAAGPAHLGAKIVGVAFFGSIAAYVAWFYQRASNAGVVVDPDGTTFIVRNPFRTIEIPWADVDHFEFEASSIGPGKGFVCRRHGPRVAIYAIQAGNVRLVPKGGERARELINQLNALLEGRRAGRSTG